mmetsp:Transcript_98399/g.155573  ORF Transcript_98399/g.155573 Transcript_98399/m.155573 type:complete len:296 (+) Transcript_98399:158-1045(+)
MRPPPPPLSGSGKRLKHSSSRYAGSESNKPTGCHFCAGLPQIKGKRIDNISSDSIQLFTSPCTSHGTFMTRCTGSSKQPCAFGKLWCNKYSAARGVAALTRSAGKRVMPRIIRSTCRPCVVDQTAPSANKFVNITSSVPSSFCIFFNLGFHIEPRLLPDLFLPGVAFSAFGDNPPVEFRGDPLTVTFTDFARVVCRLLLLFGLFSGSAGISSLNRIGGGLIALTRIGFGLFGPPMGSLFVCVIVTSLALSARDLSESRLKVFVASSEVAGCERLPSLDLLRPGGISARLGGAVPI